MTSLYGSCMEGGSPPFNRNRLPSMIFHFFLRMPSEVLSGEERSIDPASTVFPNRRLPISSEKSSSKKFTSNQVTLQSAFFIQ